jgi:hypothetical protein
MTTEQDLIFDALYEEAEPRLHEVLEEEIQIIMDDWSISPNMARRIIDAFYNNNIKKGRSNHAPKKKEAV